MSQKEIGYPNFRHIFEYWISENLDKLEHMDRPIESQKMDRPIKSQIKKVVELLVELEKIAAKSLVAHCDLTIFSRNDTTWDWMQN